MHVLTVSVSLSSAYNGFIHDELGASPMDEVSTTFSGEFITKDIPEIKNVWTNQEFWGTDGVTTHSKCNNGEVSLGGLVDNGVFNRIRILDISGGIATGTFERRQGSQDGEIIVRGRFESPLTTKSPVSTSPKLKSSGFRPGKTLCCKVAE